MKQRTKIIKQVKIEEDLRPRSPPIKRLYRLKRTLLFENAFSPQESNSYRDFEFWQSEKQHRHELNQIKYLNIVAPHLPFQKLTSSLQDHTNPIWGLRRNKQHVHHMNQSYQATMKMKSIIDKKIKLRKKSCECSECGLPNSKEVQSQLNLNNEINYFKIKRIKRNFRKYVWAVIAVLKYKQVLVLNVKRYRQYIKKKNTMLESSVSHVVTHQKEVPSQKEIFNQGSPIISNSNKLIQKFSSQSAIKSLLKPVNQILVPIKENKLLSSFYIHDTIMNQGALTRYLLEVTEKNSQKYKQKSLEQSEEMHKQPEIKVIKVNKQRNEHKQFNLPQLTNEKLSFSINQPFHTRTLSNYDQFSPKTIRDTHRYISPIERVTRITSYTQQSILQTRQHSEVSIMPLIKYQSYASLKKLKRDMLRTKQMQEKIVSLRAMIMK